MNVRRHLLSWSLLPTSYALFPGLLLHVWTIDELKCEMQEFRRFRDTVFLWLGITASPMAVTDTDATVIVTSR